ncbi:MAG: tetratricopeptide repeat protein [Methanotrichaceae archaeon]|nr:tetratricopeptide repeat protein [Methanotrichaceae archaeon]
MEKQGHRALLSGKVQEALNCYDKALKIDPDFTEACNDKCSVL